MSRRRTGSQSRWHLKPRRLVHLESLLYSDLLYKLAIFLVVRLQLLKHLGLALFILLLTLLLLVELAHFLAPHA